VVVAIVVALIGLIGIVLGALQLTGAVPAGRAAVQGPARRGARFTAVMNIVVGVFLLGLAALRFAQVL